MTAWARMRGAVQLALGLGLGLLLWAEPAHAQQIPVVHDVFVALEEMGDKLTEAVSNGLQTAQVSNIVNVLFAFFALMTFVWRFVAFGMRGFNLHDILELMFAIFFVYLLLTAYRTLVPAMASAGRYVGDALADGLIGTEDGMTLAESIFVKVLTLSLRAECPGFWGCWEDPLPMLVTWIGNFVLIVLGIIATVVEVWMQWGFEIAYAVGWMTLPFLLFRKLAFLFDGWLRFFLSVIMYDIVAKVTLSVVLVCFSVLTGRIPGAMGATIDVTGPYSLVALFLFVVVGMFVLATTGRFSLALVSGVKGVGGVLQDMAGGAARATSGR